MLQKVADLGSSRQFPPPVAFSPQRHQSSCRRLLIHPRPIRTLRKASTRPRRQRRRTLGRLFPPSSRRRLPHPLVMTLRCKMKQLLSPVRVRHIPACPKRHQRPSPRCNWIIPNGFIHKRYRLRKLSTFRWSTSPCLIQAG